MPVTLETERLLLRPWRRDDLDPYARIVADPEVMATMLGPVPRERAVAQVARFAAGDRIYHWAAELRATGELVGRIGLLEHPEFPGPDRVEVGWLLARGAWGRGLATEGGAAALAHAFGELGLSRVISLTLRGNVRSRAVMERLGMTRRGELEWRGHPHVWYAVEREAFADGG